ncbi:MAG: bifunctional DNA primase/polymerase [Rhodopila sp.]
MFSHAKPTMSRGFYNASTDPAKIETLWRRRPDQLIGIRTGATSGIDVFDVDLKHDSALAWWQLNETRLPPTRSYRTPGGGAHLYFRSHPGLWCSQDKIADRDCSASIAGVRAVISSLGMRMICRASITRRSQTGRHGSSRIFSN